jgi:hypothetical protein
MAEDQIEALFKVPSKKTANGLRDRRFQSQIMTPEHLTPIMANCPLARIL